MSPDVQTYSASDFPIGVDVERALEVLSGNVFTGEQACLRELIANAADSISRLPPLLRHHVEIRVTADRVGGILHISDNGEGMTRREAETRLGTIFGSGKDSARDIIGQFGIGFYSCFPLCTKVEVLTKSRLPEDPGTRVVYEGGKSLRVETVPRNVAGTTVKLYLHRDHRHLLDKNELRTLIQRDCDFIPYPIYLDDGWELVNKMDAPWYHNRTEEEIRKGLEDLVQVKNPLAVIPVDEVVGAGRVSGLLYIAGRGEESRFRLYSRRVLINESESSLLTPQMRRFLAAVIDAEDLPLVISRDAILEKSPQAVRLREVLIERCGNGLAQMASKSKEDFRRVFDQHGPAIKAAALEHKPLFMKLKDHFPFRSSLRPSVTLPDYLANRSDRTVIYADDMSVGASLIPLYNHLNIEVLYMTDAVDKVVRDRMGEGVEKVQFKRLDVDPPAAAKTSATVHEYQPDASSLELLRLLFRFAVSSPSIGVELRALGPNSPPAVLALMESDRNNLQFSEAVHEYERTGRKDELPPDIQAMLGTGFLDFIERLTSQTIILNMSNEVVQQLLRRVKTASLNWADSQVNAHLARFLYGQALLSSGLHLAADKLTKIAHDQTEFIALLLKPLSDKD